MDGGSRYFINAIVWTLACCRQGFVSPVLSVQTLSIIFILTIIIVAFFYAITLLTKGQKTAQHKTRNFVTFLLMGFVGLNNYVFIFFYEYAIVAILYLIGFVLVAYVFIRRTRVKRYQAGRLLLDLETGIKRVWIWSGITVSVAGGFTLWLFFFSIKESLRVPDFVFIAILWLLVTYPFLWKIYRDELREHAICYGEHIIQWQQIRSYRWYPYLPNVLNISFEPDTFFFLRDSIDMKIPPSYREEVNNILEERVHND